MIDIRHGDLFDVIPTLAADSVDAVVTDPPYGIGYAGREWDTFKPGTGKHRRLMHPREREAGKIVSDNPNINGRWRSPAMSPSQIEYDFTVAGLRGFQEWSARWAAEAFRVMKPGAYIVVCGAPRSYHRMACGLEDAGFVIRDKFSWIFGSGYPKSMFVDEARTLGTGLKPGHEPIALAWKPPTGSIKACHAEHGTAALRIDACRTDTRPEPDPRDPERPDLYQLGRWPANLVLDDDAAEELDAVAGVEGGAARFFYCAKPARSERDAGCFDLPARTGGEATNRAEGSAGLNNPRAGAGRTGGARNIHPTVKPVDLMRWLVRLVAPPGGLVLDPFNGSGTTGMACAHEGRRYVGIEKEAEYVEIARRRIATVSPLLMLAEAEAVQS